MKNVLISVFALGMIHASAFAEPLLDSDMKPISCPKSMNDDDADSEAVVHYIKKQTNCRGAGNVYTQCATGTVYQKVDQTDAMVAVCEKSIGKDKQVKAAYIRLQSVKFCERSAGPGGERQQLAYENECRRGAASYFGFLAETRD